MKTPGERLKELREREGLSMHRMSKELGMSQSTIINLERGRHQARRDVQKVIRQRFGENPWATQPQEGDSPIRKLRLEHDMDKKEFAKKCGIATMTVMNMEERRFRSFKTIEAIAQAFGIQTRILFEQVEEDWRRFYDIE